MTTSDRPPRQVAGQLRAALDQRVVVADGAMGTMLQASPVSLGDFDGHEGCNEILNLTRPDVVRSIHDAYLAAGVDCITTNTFGANLGNLGEYGLQARVEELSEAGARIARAAADAASTESRPRWVLGSVGPGTKLPTLGHVRFADLRDAYQRNVAGLLRGGVDAIVVETCQDLLQAKAAIIGARRAMAADASDLPLIAHVTIETTGSMLLGSEIGAALTALEPLGISLIGLNCATGPGEMSEHLRYLAGSRGHPGLLHAQRRAAGAHRRRRPLPADPRPARRRARDVHRRVRARPGGRLLRHHPRAPGRRWWTACGAGRSPGAGPGPSPVPPRSTSMCRSARTPRSWPSASAPTPTDRRRSARRCWPAGSTTASRSPGSRPATGRTCSTCAWTTWAGTAAPT